MENKDIDQVIKECKQILNDEKVQEAKEKAEENQVVVEKDTNVKVNNNQKKDNGFVKGLVVGALAVSLAVTGFVLVRNSKTGKVKLADPAISSTDSVDNTIEDTTHGNLKYDEETGEVILFPTQSEETTYEELTTENFENLVAEYAYKYDDEYSSVSTEDITKFAVITNIDILAEENPELIKELAGGITKEEYLNDAAKVIGASVMHDFNVWNSTKSTEGFIKVSDIVYGEQKQQMIKIEEYVDEIADAANQDDKDLVNELCAEFILDLNSGDLSKLDDGVGFAAQVNIAIVSDGIARNYLNKENFDMFQILKTSEKYVSNIFTVYDRCANDAKTLTR